LVSDLEGRVQKMFLVRNFLVTLHSNSQLCSEIFMDRLEFVRVILSLVDIGTNNSRIRESEKRVITLVREERRHAGRCVRSIVECKLSKREKLSPVVLVIRNTCGCTARWFDSCVQFVRRPQGDGWT
jgi:hypothetical protein